MVPVEMLLALRLIRLTVAALIVPAVILSADKPAIAPDLIATLSIKVVPVI